MARAPQRKSCARFSQTPSPSGSSPTPSFSSTPSPAPPSANSRNSPSANNSPTGNGSNNLRPVAKAKRFLGSGAIRRIDADVFRGEVAGPVAGLGFARAQIHDQRNVFGK